MTEVYVIFGGERGFWSRSSQWTTKLEEAKEFTREQAVAFCRKRKGSSAMDGAISAMPMQSSVAIEVIAP